MRLWRLQRSVFHVLDGEGARLFGGRWNLPGHPVVYTSESLALCALELLVHLDSDLLPADLTAYEIDVPDRLRVESIREDRLPESWRSAVVCSVCQSLGESWVERGESAILAVPSAMLIHGTNFLINPLHPDAKEVKVIRSESFALDPRLLK